ncbi:hypothetical protein ACKWTF_006585 [Chironomus riparius]
MLSYMLPVEEKSQTSRNINLNLNLQNTTSTKLHTTPSDLDHDHHEHDDVDENTKLLSAEAADNYIATNYTSNRNGNLIKNGNSKINYNMNISLCNNNLINGNSTSNDNNNINNINNNHNFNNSNNVNAIIKNSDSLSNETRSADEKETDTEHSDSVATSENTVNNNVNDETSNNNGDSKKIIKMSKLGSKNVTLKRVSFGSSKGSMVETLIFETPTPLPEHAEREFFSSVNATTGGQETNGLNDSGIELQEELERSKVRVSFFQSSKPQQVSPPCSENTSLYYGDNYYNNNSLIDSFLHNSALSETDSRMTAVIPPDFNSTDSGWDNPFRPDGDLSREADEIVNMIKGGKPITPTGDQSLLANGTHVDDSHDANGTAVVDSAMTKLEASPLLSQQNGTKSPQKTTTVNGDATKDAPQTQVSNQTVPGPQSASHVVIDEKKKKGRACCVIQ